MNTFNRETAEFLKTLDNSFARDILEKQFELKPDMKEKYGSKQIHHYIEDTKFHLSYLAEAIENDENILFDEYLGWAKVFFETLPVSDEEIIQNLELLQNELEAALPKEMSELTTKFITHGIEFYKSQSPVIPSYITEENPQYKLAKSYLRHLLIGEKAEAQKLIMEAVESGVSIKDLYLNVFQTTQKETGRLWQQSNISVAQEHYITAATQLIMAQLYPYLFTSGNKNKKIIVTCPEGELHELGARMVADIFELEGWNSYYFGANTPATSLSRSIQSLYPDVIAISTTMTFHLSKVANLIEKIKTQDTAGEIRILVGGYPFLLADGLWKKVGADGFAKDALSAVKTAEDCLIQ